jgi:hypothetical protein
MKRVLLIVAVALLIPGLLAAQPMAQMGIFFEGGYKTTYTPTPFVPFQAQLFIIQSEYYVTAVEYQVLRPDANFVITGVTYPANFAAELGDPMSGHSITFWPPMTGYPNGYDLLATYNCLTLVDCAQMPDYPLEIGPHPDSGELRGTYSPDNDFFPIIGLTSYLCPEVVGAENQSWGAIKSMFR